MVLQFVRPTSDQEIADSKFTDSDRTVLPNTTVVCIDTHGQTNAPQKQIVKVAHRPIGAELRIIGANETYSLQLSDTINTFPTLDTAERLNVPKTLRVMGRDENDAIVANSFDTKMMRLIPSGNNNLVGTLNDSKGGDLSLGSITDTLKTLANSDRAPGVVNTGNGATAEVRGTVTIGVSFEDIQDMTAFENAFRADVANLLGVQEAQVVIVNVTSGSTKVEFSVVLDDQTIGQDDVLADVANQYKTDLQNIAVGDLTQITAAVGAPSDVGAAVDVDVAAQPTDEE